MPPTLPPTPRPIPTRAPPPRPPIGTWKAGLCACADDPSLSCFVCCCGPNATGQVYERAYGGGCLSIAAFLWLVYLFSEASYQSSDYVADPDLSGILLGIASTLLFVGALWSTYFLCVARRWMRRRDSIPEGCCGEADDCCVSYWCGCCALVQMFRQEEVGGKTYRACTATGV